MPYEVIQDTVLSGTNQLGVGASAQVTIKSAVTGELVSLYQDRDGDSGETNPFNADASGQFRVYAAPGRLQITVVYNSVTRIWEDFRLGDPSVVRKRRLNLNGEMCVAQAGTSFAGVGAAGGDEDDLDGWLIYTAGSPQARVTVTQEAGTGEFRNWRKVDCTTAEAAVAAGELLASITRIEAQDIRHLEYGAATARSLVVTFRVKSPKTGTHCVAIKQPDGSRYYVREFTIAAADTEEEHSVIIPGDASGTINNDTGSGLEVVFPHVCGSTFQGAADAWGGTEIYATSNQQNLLDSTDNNFEITGVQAEVGEEATAFEHRAFPDELDDCLRYYEKSYNYSTAPGTATAVGAVQHFESGATNGDHILRIHVRFKVRKRATPTVAIYDEAGTAGKVTMQAGDGISAAVVTHGETGTRVGGTNGAASTSRILSFQYTADARL